MNLFAHLHSDHFRQQLGDAAHPAVSCPAHSLQVHCFAPMNSLETEGPPQARFRGSPAPAFSRNISHVVCLCISIVPAMQKQALWTINNLCEIVGREVRFVAEQIGGQTHPVIELFVCVPLRLSTLLLAFFPLCSWEQFGYGARLYQQT